MHSQDLNVNSPYSSLSDFQNFPGPVAFFEFKGLSSPEKS